MTATATVTERYRNACDGLVLKLELEPAYRGHTRAMAISWKPNPFSPHWWITEVSAESGEMLSEPVFGCYAHEQALQAIGYELQNGD